MTNSTRKRPVLLSPVSGLDRKTYMELTKPAIINQRYQDDGHTAIIDIDGFIGSDPLREFLTGEKSTNTVKSIRSTLREINSSKIIVNINSPGGDLNDGLVIMDMLQSKDAQVITNLMGFSASAAIVVSQAGSVRRMSVNAFELIHRAMFGVCGYINQNTCSELTADMEVIDNQLIGMFARRASISSDEIADLMDEGGGYGKWIDAEEALDYGLVDELYDPADEEDENLDRMEPDQSDRIKENTRNLANAGLKSLSKSDRQAEIESLSKKQNDLERVLKKLTRSNTAVNYRRTKVNSRVANHEAAHAVMALVFGVSIDKIETWNPGENAFNAAVTMGSELVDKEPWQRAAIAMAGAMADWQYYGKSLHDFTINNVSGNAANVGSDRYQVNEALKSLTGVDKQKSVNRAVNFCKSRMIRNEHHIKSLATEIRKQCQMSRTDVEAWFQKATKYDKFYY